MTRDEAKRLCDLIPSIIITEDTGFGRTCSDGFASTMRRAFPEFNWRVFLDRSCEYSRWALTIDDAEPREHYAPRGGECIHCMKTAAELGVEEQDD